MPMYFSGDFRSSTSGSNKTPWSNCSDCVSVGKENCLVHRTPRISSEDAAKYKETTTSCGRSFSSIGAVISLKNIESLLEMRPRRHNLSDWEVLRVSTQGKKDWRLKFPFFESYAYLLEEYLACRSELKLRTSGFEDRIDKVINDFTYLKNPNADQLEAIRTWIEELSGVVGIRDFLRISLALDYTSSNGKPDSGFTEVARLRQRAKLYRKDIEPSDENRNAADCLAGRCVEFLKSSHAFSEVDAVVAVPGSAPRSKFSVPERITQTIAKAKGLLDLSSEVQTVKFRQGMKNTLATSRLKVLEGTITVGNAVKGKRILIVDDLYQTGTTINYVGKLLLDTGAKCVYGLCCEKTCSNTD